MTYHGFSPLPFLPAIGLGVGRHALRKSVQTELVSLQIVILLVRSFLPARTKKMHDDADLFLFYSFHVLQRNAVLESEVPSLAEVPFFFSM